jgi:DNA-binding response OmpR family regulator
MFKKAPAVVIAESDRRSSDAVASALRRTGYSTVEVKTGGEALELARREDVELLVLEVTLPDMTGYEVCRTLRDEGDETPIFFLSATHTDSVDRVAGLLLGADDYLAKPFDPNELVARAHRHIRRRETAGTSRRHSAPRLTPREEQILKLLARGRTLKQVAAELTISPKTVGTHIQNLFAKFDVHHRAELVARAYALRLVEPETTVGPAGRDRDSA